MTQAAAAALDNAFRLDEVSVRFPGLTALDRVSLAIAPGERVGLVGPSGAGKTTLLRLLNAAQQADEGRLTLLGRPLSSLDGKALKNLRAQIGFIPQRFHLVPSLRVLQNVLLGRLGHQGFWASFRTFIFPNRREQLEAYKVLARVGISEKLFLKTDHLSGGQLQRVAIARALYQAPQALLADEPVASVDPIRARATMALLNDLAAEGQLTLVISLHDQELARSCLPRLIGLREGRIFKDAPSEAWTDEDFAALYHLNNSDTLENTGSQP